MWVWISALFFLSGATSLVYETLWIRVLSLAVGSTSAAMSLVLALFFLGLSAGSWLSARWLTRLHRPLRTYALLEGLIGITSAVLIYGLVHFHSILAYLPLQGSMSWIGTVAKFSLVGLLLALPTLAMGATLPLIVKVFALLPGSPLRSVSLLYAINTFGAVFGALSASFWLLPRLGLIATNQLSAATNGLLLLLGLYLDHKKRHRALELTSDSTSATEWLAELTGFQKGLIALSGICGFSALATEVAWNKYLGIFLGNNIYGLGLVLGLYLFGIAVGSLILYFVLPRTQKPERLFWGMLLALPVLIAGTSYLFNFVPAISLSLAHYVSPLVARVSACALLLLPFTLLLGALFPLTVHLLAPQDAQAPRAVGLAYAINTLGAIFGSCLAGLVFIPLWGSSNTIRLSAALLCLGALALVRLEGIRWRRPTPILATLSLVAVIFIGNLDFRRIIQSAYFQHTELAEGEEFVWMREGETSIITLSHDPQDGENYKEYLRLKTNGLNESVYNKGNLQQLPRYEALLGLLPYLFSERPQKAFVVGYGGGYTVDLLTRLPLQKVHVIELEKAILEAADYAHNGNNAVTQRKNLALEIEDARFILAAKLKAPLDIILSQPSHSWLAGAANLFTREFFQIVRSNLSERGVFSQWLNLYNMDTTTLKSILATFYEVFPYGAVFSGQHDQEMILIGSPQPLRFNTREAMRIAASPMFRHRLANVPFNSASDVLSHFALSRESIVKISQGSRPNTDTNAYAETRQSRTFYTGVTKSEDPQAFLTTHYQGGFADILDGTQDWAYSILVSLQQTGQYDKFFSYLNDFESRYAKDPKRHAQLGYLCLQAQRYASAVKYLESAYRQDPTPANHNLWVYALVELGDYRRANALLAQRATLDRIAECYSAQSHLAQGTPKAIAGLIHKMAANVPAYTQACGDYFNRLMGEYYSATHQYEIAIPFWEAYAQAMPNDPSTLKQLSVGYLNLKNWDAASDASQRLSNAVRTHRLQLDSLARFYEDKGLSADAQVLDTRRQTILN